jgi:hypothetical protein
LVIEDPFDSSVNIGKSVFAMHRVKAAFNYALSALLSPSPYPYALAPCLLSRVINLYGKALPSSMNNVCWNPRRVVNGEDDGEYNQWAQDPLKINRHLAHLEVPGLVGVVLNPSNSSPNITKRIVRRNISNSDSGSMKTPAEEEK